MLRGASGAAALLSASALAFVAQPAHADSYGCTVDGTTIVRPWPPAECKDRPIYRIRPDGRPELPEPPLTPEQLRAREAAEKLEREAAERAREKMRRDFWLLDRYRSEGEIDVERDRELAALQARIDAARNALDGIERERVKLQQEAEFYARRELPANLKGAIESNVARRAVQEKVRADMRDAMERVNKDYDARRDRYRELTQPGPRGRVPATK